MGATCFRNSAQTCVQRAFYAPLPALFRTCRDGSRIPDDALVAAEEKYQELIDQLHER